GKVNFFANGNYNQSGGQAKSATYRQNKDSGIVQDYFNQYSLTDRRRHFASVRFGMDYFLDNRNTLTLTQNFGSGHFTSNEQQTQEYLDINHLPNHYGARSS